MSVMTFSREACWPVCGWWVGCYVFFLILFGCCWGLCFVLIFFFDCCFFPSFFSFLDSASVMWGTAHCLIDSGWVDIYSGTLMLWADNKPLCVCVWNLSFVTFPQPKCLRLEKGKLYASRFVQARIHLSAALYARRRAVVSSCCCLFILIVFFFFSIEKICSKVGVS